MKIQYINLDFARNCVGYGGQRLTLGTVRQFLETLENHFNPSRGYFYTGLPTGGLVTGDAKLRNEFDQLPVLARLKNYRTNHAHSTTIAIPTQQCSFCNGLHNIPPTITSARVRCRPGNNSLDTIIAPILSTSAKVAFIDPYLRLTPNEEATRFANWITNSPYLTHVAFIRGDRDAYNTFINHINNLNGLLGNARWNALHIRAFVISEATARLHARYIHTDQFTLGIEGGFQFQNCGADEMTDVYILDTHQEVDDNYIIDRNTHFTTVSAWDKPPNGGSTLQAADINLPSFAP